MTTPDSPIVSEVRERARVISARYGHDADRYARHLARIEAEHHDRLVTVPVSVRDGPDSNKPAA